MKFLEPHQQLALKLLAESKLSEKFYWTGGTLLSYHYLQHRFSQDVDFFSQTRFSFLEINSWVQNYKGQSGFKKVSSKKIHDRWEFIFDGKVNFRLDFAYYNQEKKTLKSRKKLLGVFIDSIEDIAANKIVSLIDRQEPKDLFDLYFIIKKFSFGPDFLLTLAKKKFGVEFSESLFWSEAFKLLPLLKEIQPLMIPEYKDNYLEKIERFVKQNSADYLKKACYD